jgi:hypothetical protein
MTVVYEFIYLSLNLLKITAGRFTSVSIGVPQSGHRLILLKTAVIFNAFN